MIELIGVSKQFKTANGVFDALKDIDLSVQAGEIFGIIGKSGAGKSTLIRCINRLENPSAGKIIIDGENICGLSNAQLISARRKMGMIFQHFNLLSSRTVAENIALPLELAGCRKAEIQQKIEPLIALTGLAPRRDHYPSALSGGQKQRVAIARALANDPKILLCDEATSALDPETTQSILDLLKTINRELNLTILLITHEMAVIKSICDHVAVIEAGEIIEQNQTVELFTQPQTSTAKTFVRTDLHMQIPEALSATFSEEPNGDKTAPLVQIFFHGGSSYQPIISQLSRQYHIDATILQAQMAPIKDHVMGVMLVKLTGPESGLTAALAHLHTAELQSEVLGYVVNHDLADD